MNRMQGTMLFLLLTLCVMMSVIPYRSQSTFMYPGPLDCLNQPVRQGLLCFIMKTNFRVISSRERVIGFLQMVKESIRSLQLWQSCWEEETLLMRDINLWL